MPRYRTLNNNTEINVFGTRLRAGPDGVFEVASGSPAEQVLIAGGAIDERLSGGRVCLYLGAMGYTKPLAQITWAGAAVLFALPGGSIPLPKGIIKPGATELRVSVLWVAGANTGGMNNQIVIGTSNSFSDSQAGGQYIGANNEWDQVASFTFPDRLTMTQASSNSTKNGAPAGALGYEFTNNINTDAQMWINFGCNNGSTNGNVLKIVRAMVEVFQ